MSDLLDPVLMSQTESDATPLIASVWSHYVIFGCSIFAILWGGINAMMVSSVKDSSLLRFWRVNQFLSGR